MALATLSSIKRDIGVGVRPNLFRVSVSGIGTATTLSTLCKAAALPGSTIGNIEIPMAGGRRYKVGGDRTFAEWTMTVILDQTYTLRRAFESYQNQYVSTNFDLVTSGSRVPAASTVTVEQLGVNNLTIKKYELKNAFVSDISTIDLSYDSTDAVSEYTVTWVYDYFIVQ